MRSSPEQSNGRESSRARVSGALSVLTTLLMICCAVIVTVMAIRARSAGANTPSQIVAREVHDWQHLVSRGHRSGSSAAPVTIVEFADFQCPFCAKTQTTIRSLRSKYPDSLTVVYRHLPLSSIHLYARGAALAAECAGAQGRFFEFADSLYGAQKEIGARSWVDFATKAGVPDVAEFQRCMIDERYDSAIRADSASADSLDIYGTPVLIVNGELFEGAMAPADLEREVRNALSRPRSAR